MTNIPWLSDVAPKFPPIENVSDDPNGLIAAGGNLDVPTLLAAYNRGIFPWYNPEEPILWWSPSPRMILEPKQIHLSKSTKKYFNKNSFTVTVNNDFEQVINHCASIRAAAGTWISKEMIIAYCKLHEAGYAHSFEVRKGDQLVGGLYGIAIGHVFFGESMFSLKPNSSKLAFFALAKCYLSIENALIDCQVSNPFLISMGCSIIDRTSFNGRLQQAVSYNNIFSSSNFLDPISSINSFI